MAIKSAGKNPSTPGGAEAGGINLPSSSFVDTICGALGVLTFGDGSINNESKLLASLSKPNVIYGELQKISKAISDVKPSGKLSDKLSDISGEAFLKQLKGIISNKVETPIDLGIQLLNNNFVAFANKYEETINNLIDSTEKLSCIAEQGGSNDSANNIEVSIKTQIEGASNLKDIANVIDNLKNLDLKSFENIGINVRDLSIAIDNLSKLDLSNLENIDITNIDGLSKLDLSNLENIDITNITTSLDNLSKLDLSNLQNIDITNITTSLDNLNNLDLSNFDQLNLSINDISDAISNLAEIDLKSLGNLNVKEITNSITNLGNVDGQKIIDICTDLNTAFELLDSKSALTFSKAIEAFGDSFDKFEKLGKEIKDKGDNKTTEKITAGIERVKKIFSNDLAGLFNQLAQAVSGDNVKNIDASCVTLSELLSSLISVVSMDQSKVSDDGVKLLAKITGDRGPIKKIFSNIQDIDASNTVALKSVEKIFTIIGKFNDLSTIGFKAGINVRRGLRILTTFVNKDLPYIFNSINSLGDESKDIAITVNNISRIIGLIPEIVKVDADWDEVRLKINFLKFLIEQDLMILFEKINFVAEAASSDKSINGLLDSVNKVTGLIKQFTEIKSSDVENAMMRLEDVKDLFNTKAGEEGELYKLLLLVGDGFLAEMTKEVETNVDKINTTIDCITGLFENLPGLVSLFKTQFKLDMMADLTNSINDILNGNVKENIIGISNISSNEENVKKLINTYKLLIAFINKIDKGIDSKVLSNDIDKNLVIISLLSLINYEFNLVNKLSDINENKLSQIENFVLNFTPEGRIGIGLQMVDKELAKKAEDLLDIIFNISVALLYTKELTGIKVDKSLKQLEEFVLFFAPEGQIGMALQMIDNDTTNKVKDLFEIIKDLSVVLLYTAELSKLKINVKGLKSLSGDVIVELHNILIGFSSLEGDEKQIKDNASKIVAIADVFKALGTAAKFGKLAEAGLKMLNKEIDMIANIVEKFNAMEPKNLDSALEIINAFSKLMIVSAAVLIVGALAMAMIDVGNLMMFGITLGSFMWLISKSITSVATTLVDAMNVLEDFKNLIVASAVVLLVGALAMKIINIADLALFGVTLAGFIYLTVLPFKWFAQTQASVFNALQDFTIFVVATAAVLILGSLIMKHVELSDLLIFTGSLFLFVTAMCLPFWLFNKAGKDVMLGMKDFTIFVVASAAVLILGSLIMKHIEPEDLLLFTATLGGFVLAMCLPFWLFNVGGKGAIRGMKDFTIFVVASAAVLIFGSMLMTFVDTNNLLIFGATMVGFVIGLCAPFLLFNKNGKGAMRGMKDFTIFVVASAAILILGSIILDHISIPNLVLFGTILASFVFAITWAFNKNSKDIKKAMPSIIAMMVCTALSAAVLLIGANAMADAGIGNTIAFTVILAGFITGMIFALKFLNGAKKDVLMGVAVLGLLTVVCGLAAGVLMLAGKIMKENDLLSLIGGTAMIALIIVGIAGIAMGLGAIINSGIGGAILWAGIGAMAAIVGVALMAGMALLAISNAMLIMKKVGKLDIGALIGNITGFLSIAAALAPIGLMAPIIIAASVAVMTMTAMMSMIAQAVKDYAELKIPIYSGTKITGYRQLDSKDFETAAENVKAIITTLGQAVIDVYEENPEIFTSGKFTIVTGSLKTLGPMIAKIARGVKDYAELKVPIYKGTEVSGYRQLTKKDFDSAAQNVKKIIVTLAGALIDTYEENPAMFKGGSDSPFNIVSKSCGNLGKLISKIADGVKDYADLKVAVSWDKEGKPNQYRSLSKSDFNNAANNIKNIITTLANAVIDVYNTDPKLFDDGSDSVFNTVMKSCMNLGKMMSKIAAGVKDYANLTIPVKWNDEGKAVSFRNMDPSEIILAGENVKKIIKTLATAVVEVYNQSPELFDDGDKSTFNIVLKSCTNLGKMMAKISSGVQSYAKLQIPIAWNNEGKPIKFEKMKDSDILAAGFNVKTIIKTLAQAVVDVYNQSPQLFEDGDKSTFNIVMKSCTNLGKMMSNIAKGLQSYAKLQFATDWDKDGKAIKFDRMKDADIVNAGENIKKVIIALASAIVQTYHMDPTLFADPKKGDNIFNKVMKSVSNLGQLLSDIAKGLQSYANLQYAIQWNAEGKPIKFERLKDQDLVNAGTNISKVITTMAKAIIDTYTNNPDMFTVPKDGQFGAGQSKFDMVMKSVSGLGKLMTDICKGVQAYANLQYAIAWDKDGKAIKFQKMTDADILKAGENIGKVITTMSKAIIDTYDLNPEMFAQPDEKGLFGLPAGKGTSKFDLVMKSVSGLGKVMSEISKGVQSYANLQYAIEWNNEGQPTKYKKMSDSDVVKAGENIGKVIVTMSKAIVDTYDLNPELFAQPTEGIFGTKKGTSKFDLVMKSVSGLGKVMSKISEGVQAYANLQYPVEWNNEGTAIKFRSMSDSDVVKAGENIGKVIVTMSKAIVDTYDLNPEMFAQPTEGIFGEKKGTSKFDLVMKSVSGLGKLMAKICEGVQSYANLQYPIAWNNEGTAIKFRTMSDSDVLKAGENISKVILTMSKAIVDTYDLNPKMFEQPSEGIFGTKKGTSKFDLVMKSVSGLGKLMGTICEGVQSYANLQYPVKWNKDGQPIEFKGMTDSDVTKAGENIALVITTMSKAIIDTYDKNPKMFEQPNEGIFGTKKGTSKFDLVMKSVSGLGKLMTDICQGIQNYANLNYATKWNEQGQAIAFEKMSEADVKKAGENIALVITTMSKAIMDTYDKNPKMFEEPSASGVMGFFGKKESSKFSKVMGTIGGLGLLMKDISTGLQAYANLQYATKWNDQGQAIAFEKMKDGDIKNAGTNIATIITTMSKAIIDTYDNNKDMFDEPSAGGVAGFFGKKDQSKFGKVMGTIGGLGILMKDISEGVQAYANLQYAVEWNKEGQAIKFQKMSDADIKKAGENIGEVIKVMSKAIIETYEKNPEMFEEPSAGGVAGFFGKKESSKFSKVMGTIGGLGILMKDISTALQAYANLQYPVEWNSEGQAIKFEKLGAEGIKAAADNIGIVIKTLSQAIIDTYNKNPDMFEEPKASGVAGFFGKKDPSKFAKVMGTIGGLGVLLKDISTGLQSYASLKFADTWNADGTVASYKQMGPADFETAATNIGIVIKTLSKAIFDTYDMNPQYFEEPESSSCWGLFKKKGKSKAAKVMSAIGGLGALVSGVAQGVKDFSTMQFADQWDSEGNPTHYVPIKPADMVAASKNIGEVIKVLAQAIIDVYNASPGGMFTDQTVTTGKLFWKKVHTIEGSSPFTKVIKALGGLGELVSGMAQGVKDFANMSFADQWDKDGNPIHWQRLTPDEMKAAGVACGEVIKVLANAVISVSKSATWSDVVKAQHCVVPMLNDLSGVIGKIAQQLKIYARNEIPLKWDKDGNVIEYTTVDFEAAAATAAQVCMTLANGMIEVAGENSWWKIQKARDVAKVVNELSSAIAPIGKGLRIFGMKQIPIAFDKDGNPTQFIDIDFEAAAKTASDVMATLATAMVNIYESKTKTSWGGLFQWNNFKKAEQQVVPILKGVGASLLPIAHSVKIFGMKKIPLRYDKEGNPIEFTEIDFNAAGATAGFVLSTLANAVVDVANSNYWFDLKQAKQDVIPILNDISKLLVPLAYSLHYYGIEKIPVRWKEDGSVAESRTVDFKKAGEIAGFILNTLPDAVVKVAKGAAWYDLKQAKDIVVPTIDGISKLLAPLAYSLHYYGIEKIPVRWNEDGSVADSRSVDFKKAGEIAGFILNTLPDAVVKVAKGAAWYDLEQARDIVVPTIDGISKLLAPLAYSLHYYGIEKIPVRWKDDGSVADAITVDFVKAGEVAGFILNTLPDAVVKVAKGAAWYDLEQARDIVVPTIDGISKVLAPLAKSLYYYGIDEIPLEWDNEGNIIKSLKVDFVEAANTAGKVLKTLGNAVVDVAKGGWQRDLIQARDMVVPTIEGISKVLAPLAKSLYYYSIEQIPVSFDENGKVLDTITVEYKQAANTAGKVLKTLGNAVVDVAKGAWAGDLIQARDMVIPVISEISKLLAPLTYSLHYLGLEQIPVRWNEDGSVADTRTVDFKKAGEIAGYILETLPQAVVNVAKSAWWFDLKQARQDVIPLINDITKALVPLTYSLHYLGMEQIPVRWNEDGSIAETHTVDFEKAAKIAGDILGTLPQAVVNVAKSAWWFDLKQARQDVIPLIDDITKALVPLTYSLHYLGMEQIPLGYDKDGNVIKSDKVDFKTAGEIASQILNTLPEAVVKVAKSAAWYDLEQAQENVIPVIDDIRRLLVPLSYSLYSYGSGKIPVVFGPDGDVLKSLEVDFDKAGEIASNILETLPKAVVKVASEYNFKKERKNLDVLFETIDEITRRSGKISKALYYFGNNLVPFEIDANGDVKDSKEVDFVKAGEVFNTVFSTISTSIATSLDLIKWDKYREKSKVMFESINEYIKAIGNLSKSLQWIGSGQAPIEFDQLGNPVKFIDVNYEKGGEMANLIITSIGKSIEMLFNDYNKVIQKLKTEKTIKTLMTHIKDISNTSLIIDELKPIKDNTLTEVIEYIGKNIVLINEKFENIDLKKFFEILSKSELLKEIISILNKTAQIVEKTPGNEFEIMAEGIDMMNKSISEMPKQDVFEHNQKILNKYVKTINAIDIKKINSLKGLVDSMNYLGYKFGNLDKFTEVLAKQMSNVLKKLSDELAIASKTIKDAEKLQKERESSIKRSISEINGLLGQTMKVEITQGSSDGGNNSNPSPSTPGGGGGGGNSAPEQTTPGGGGGGYAPGNTIVNNNNNNSNYNGNSSSAGSGGKMTPQDAQMIASQVALEVKKLMKK